MPDPRAITGILLAAGRSVRFGSDKLLHALDDGTPLVLGAARPLRAACQHAVAVVRPDSGPLAALLADEGYQVIESAEARLGMGHSLAAGVRAAADAGGWLVALADMPFIAPATCRRVADALRRGSSIAAPSHAGRRGHPVGFSRRWFDALVSLQGDHGARAILDAFADEICACEVEDSGIWRDIDRPADLVAAAPIPCLVDVQARPA